MKIGRNQACPCGSGKKYKHCCIKNAGPADSIAANLEQALAMNPELSQDELNALLEHRVMQQNDLPRDDFFGLSASQIENWLYAPLAQVQGFKLAAPKMIGQIQGSPVMRYVQIMLDAALVNEGVIKATATGNMPTALIKQASTLLPQFEVAKFEADASVSEFQGVNENQFNAFHYARVLLELLGVFEFKKGCFYLAEHWHQVYQLQGLQGLFVPLLSLAIRGYNWAYFDNFEEVDLSLFAVFLLWRLPRSVNLDVFSNDITRAFPALLDEIEPSFGTKHEYCQYMIESRFIMRFLQYWGFAVLDPRIYQDGVKLQREVELMPLYRQVFEFKV